MEPFVSSHGASFPEELTPEQVEQFAGIFAVYSRLLTPAHVTWEDFASIITVADDIGEYIAEEIRKAL